MFYLCPQVNLAIYQLIDDSPIVKNCFIDYNLKKSIKVDSTWYLSCGYFFFAIETRWLLSICGHISIVLHYFSIILNSNDFENFPFFGTMKNSWKKNEHFCKASKIKLATNWRRKNPSGLKLTQRHGLQKKSTLNNERL